MPETTQEEFLKDLNPKEEGVFEAPLTPEAPKPEKEEEESEEQKFNRRERRLAAKLQAEREAGIVMAARLEALTEAQKLRNAVEPSEYLKSVERIYGTNSPEAQEATELLKSALKGVEERATNRALEQFREEQRKEREAVAKEEKTLDTMVEQLEDEYNVSLDSQTKKSFFQLLEKLSPKDSNGEVIAYADHHAVWEELQSRKQQPTNRAKDLASRSMVKTGASPSTTVETDSNERWLKENGII